MENVKFYICEHCKNIIVKVADSGVPVVCCGEEMKELVANSKEAATEKHLPVVNKLEGNGYEVVVGSVIHPMEAKHYIEFIVVETSKQTMTFKLNPGDEPKVTFATNDEIVNVYEYCNLHGLWVTKI